MKTEDIAISITGYSYSNIKETIPDGVDKEEIAAVYEEIIDEYLQKGIPREIPALINVSEIPGAGKSTFCKKLLAMPENSSAIYIGFDAIMENERLPYIREEVNHAEEAFKRWELSARIAGYELLKRAIENKYLIIFDHSSALPQHIDLFNLLLSEGYEVHFNFIFIPEEEARRRAKNRKRYIPPYYIEERSKILQYLLPEYKRICTTFKQIEPMRTRLIIARHGNTFRPEETPTRVGAKTDLPLVEEFKGRSIGRYLKEHDMIPDVIYAAPLLRTMQTARLAVQTIGLDSDISSLNAFVEIDYGVDENKTEEEVRLRLGNGNIEKGKKIIEDWDKNAVVPDGWKVDPDQIIHTWLDFTEKTVIPHQTTLLVTSNGIIRFAPYLTGDFEKFAQEHKIKVAPGGLCIFDKNDGDSFWTCSAWNVKPYELYADSRY